MSSQPPISVCRYESLHKNGILDVSLRAWGPVFAKLKPAVQSYVYEAFYPNGWEERQISDITDFLDQESHNVWVALSEGALVGWLGLRIHQEDNMGEIYILAVDPDHQRKGIGKALLGHGLETLRSMGLRMVMVETGDDAGHAPSRAAYEAHGFTRWPVARYFRQL